MDPILTGVLANLAYDLLKETDVRFPGESTKLGDAAEEVAASYDGLRAEDLIGLMESERMDELVRRFEQGGKAPTVAEIAKILEDHPVSTFTDVDSKHIAEEFLTALERRFVADPDHFRRLILEQIEEAKLNRPKWEIAQDPELFREVVFEHIKKYDSEGDSKNDERYNELEHSLFPDAKELTSDLREANEKLANQGRQIQKMREKGEKWRRRSWAWRLTSLIIGIISGLLFSTTL